MRVNFLIPGSKNSKSHRIGAKGFFFVLSIFCLLFSAFSVSAQPLPDLVRLRSDYDGDGRGDLILYNPGAALFTVRPSSSLDFVKVAIGAVGDRNATGDYNGDGKTDLATLNPSTALWTIAITGGNTVQFRQGLFGDIPLPGKFTAKSCTNPVSYNPLKGIWIVGECDGSKQLDVFVLGGPGHFPVVADFDCDGLDDAGVFNRRTGVWTYRQSSKGNALASVQFGLPGDIPAPGRYSNDSCVQLGVHRPLGNRFIFAKLNALKNGQGVVEGDVQYGLPGDDPLPANVDGDPRLDQTIFRPWENTFYIKTSVGSTFRVPFANQGSIPLPLGSARQHLRKIQGDYNRDGKSDFVFAEVDRNLRRTVMHVRHGATKGATDYILSVPGDAIVPGDFNGDGQTQAGVVFVQQDGTLLWDYLAADGTEKSLVWGVNGDTPLAGDLDCDGKDDRIVVRETNGTLYWFILFAKGDSIFDLPFGFKGDTPRVSDLNGDGCDELMISRNSGGGIDWWFQNLNDSQPTYVQWGLTGDKLLNPADIDGDGFADFIIVRLVSGKGAVAFIRYAKGSTDTLALGTSLDTPVVGDFTGLGFAELGQMKPLNTGNMFSLKRANFFDDFIGYGLPIFSLVRPDGTVVPPEGSGGGSTGGGSGGGSVGGGPLSCDVTKPWNNGRLWKPVSTRGKPVILFPAEYWTTTPSVELFAQDGSKILDFARRRCCPNGNRAHWDATQSCSSMQSKDPLTLRMNRSNGVKECYSVPNACGRYE